jgi:hypothetical protein
MKRSLFFLMSAIALILSISFQKLAAQNTAPYWSLVGNSNASSTLSKLGTTNAINLRLFTNNIERVHINSSNGYVGIGTSAPAFRLQVVNAGTSIYGNSTGGYGVYGNSTGPTTYAGIFGVGRGTGVRGFGKDYGAYDSSTNSGIGVYGASNLNFVSGRSTTGVYGKGYYGVYGNGGNYGVYGNSTNYIGVYGSGGAYGLCGISGNYGVYGAGGRVAVYGFTAYSSGVAVRGKATGSFGYGGYFESSNSIGVYANTGNSNAYAGYFGGNVFSSGSYQGSDRKLKQNITDVKGAMDIINKLQPKYYEFRQDGNYKLMNLPQGKHYGLIAQDVEEVLPGLVKETEFDAGRALPRAEATNINQASNQEKGEVINFKALNYTELIPIMVKGMQELSKKTDEIDLLKKKNNELEERLLKLETIVLNKNNSVVELSSASLEQNSPNPFNSETIIRYHLPQTATNAKIVITGASGRTMKTLTLTGRGAGEINLNSGTLAAGSYNYTLWMDGKQVDSKKMVITK